MSSSYYDYWTKERVDKMTNDINTIEKYFTRINHAKCWSTSSAICILCSELIECERGGSMDDWHFMYFHSKLKDHIEIEHEEISHGI